MLRNFSLLLSLLFCTSLFAKDFITPLEDIMLPSTNNYMALTGSGSIGGSVFTCAGDPIEDVKVKLNSDQPDFPIETFTDANGEYAFPIVKGEVNYTITPCKQDGILEGISTLDLVLLLDIITGQQGDFSACAYIAADVNNDLQINTADLYDLLGVLLGNEDAFTNNDSWAFVDASFDFFDEENPWPYPRNILLTDHCDDSLDNDFRGIKIGDISGNTGPIDGGDFDCENLPDEGICDYLAANPDEELATLDCDMGGVDNATECANGTNPLDPDDDMEDMLVCSTPNLSPFINGSIQDINNANVEIGDAEIDIDINFFGNSSLDENVINSSQTSGDLAIRLGVSQAGSFASRMETTYSFSRPVCSLSFTVWDIDGEDEMVLGASLNGAQVTFNSDLGSCLVRSGNSITTKSGACETGVNGDPAHSVTIEFDDCIDEFTIGYYDREGGNGGSYSLVLHEGCSTVSDETEVCSSLNLNSFINDNTNDLNNANVQIGNAELQIDFDYLGSSGPDENVINSSQTQGDLAIRLGVLQAGSFSDRMETTYSFSEPVCSFSITVWDIDGEDEMRLNALLNGSQVSYTSNLGSCLTRTGTSITTINNDCEKGVSGDPDHAVTIVFNGCIDEFTIGYFDREGGNGGSYSIVLNEGCTAIDNLKQQQAETRSKDIVQLVGSDMFLRKNKEYTINLKLKNHNNLKGIQGEFDLSSMDIPYIGSDVLKIDEKNVFKTKTGLRFIAIENKDNSFHDGNESILRLRVKPKRNGLLSKLLSFNDNTLQAEIYTGEENIISRDLSLEFSVKDVPQTKFKIHQNFPNPFSDITNIKFDSQISGKVDFKIFDASGKSIFVDELTVKRGLNTVTVNESIFPYTGAYIYSIGDVSKKMIIIK